MNELLFKIGFFGDYYIDLLQNLAKIAFLGYLFGYFFLLTIAFIYCLCYLYVFLINGASI
jgi:hypothetical protein